MSMSAMAVNLLLELGAEGLALLNPGAITLSYTQGTCKTLLQPALPLVLFHLFFFFLLLLIKSSL